jgi:GTPase SAR1 family protein
MSFSLDYYSNRKNKLFELMNSLSLVLEDMGSELDMKVIAEEKEQILKEKLQVVVVGEFSRGKSTFINALLGKKVLPSSARPTTTLLNVISYSKEPFINIHFRDNKGTVKISEEIFNKLIAPKEPLRGDRIAEEAKEKQNELFKTIKYTEIGYPLSFCEAGVEIIDTPGTNDLDPAREQLTNSIIPKSDAAILILSAVKILSESEMSFLKDRILANDIQKIFIVINFRDLLESPDQIEKVYHYAYENLKSILHEPKIFMVAAKQALNAKRKEAGEEMVTKKGRPISVWDIEKTGFLEFESSLSDFLQYERGNVKLQKPTKRLSKLIEKVLEKQIAFEHRSLDQQMDGIQEKVLAFRPKLDKVRQIGKDSLRKIVIKLNQEEKDMNKWYESELQKISDKGMQTLEQYRNLSVNEISAKVEQAIAPMERRLHENKKEKMTETAKTVIKSMSNEISEEWFKLENEMQNIGSFEMGNGNFLSMEIAQDYGDRPSIFDELLDNLDTAWEKSNSFIGKLTLGVGYAAAIVVGVVSFLFNWLSGEDEKTKFRHKLSTQFDESKKQKQMSLENEWKSMVNAIYAQYKETVNSNVQEIENQLNQLLENSRLEEREIEKKLVLLNRRAVSLNKIKNDLDNLLLDLSQPQQQKVGAIR